MPNTFFRFKQFTIHQELSAMKVCTDSCILGAWTAKQSSQSKRILDIGTGTGLLALMLAQKSVARIDAIEIDTNAATQARENIIASPWAARIRLAEGDIRTFKFDHKFDRIICNPPFYESDLQSPRQSLNRAKHSASLTFEDLIAVISQNLSMGGNFSILLPFHRNEYFEMLAKESGFFLWGKLIVRQSSRHQPFRTLELFGTCEPEKISTQELIIKNEEGKNSAEFSELMKDYYL